MPTSPTVAPLLTIAIPTYNRAGYLALALERIGVQMPEVPSGTVEIVVSDNCSPDRTAEVVRAATTAAMPIRYVRNEKNLGWALNFVQCFELAAGRHVLVLGDDDVLIDGTVALLVARLRAGDYGVVCLRPYGFDRDYLAERPASPDRERVFADAGDFFLATHRFFTLISAMVLNKSLLRGVDPRQFLDTELGIFHLVLRAALAAQENLLIERYLMASKRQNSFAYNWSEAFIIQYWRIIDAQREHGLRAETIRVLERRTLLADYPFYLFDLRRSGREKPADILRKLRHRFGGSELFVWWTAPVLWLPRPLALAWGAATTAAGRIGAGDLRRGLKFACDKIFRPRN